MKQPQFLQKTEKEKPDYALLSFEPLDPGYGHTLGNALRRTLLTSIRGAAITQVKIAKVKHMFSTLPGMKEDIVEFILNLKEILVKYDGKDPVELSMDVSGPGEVKAGDLKLPSGVEVLNPELVLANLTDKKTNLKATITVETGFGYVASHERKTDQIGVIPVDASFSPVKRVRFDVRQTRVGRYTDFDKLQLEIWTDGTIDPKKAVKRAGEVLLNHFKQIVEPIRPDKKVKDVQSTQELEVLKLTVEELDLPTRIANALRKGGYKTVKDLTTASREDIAKVKNIGGKSVDSVIKKIEEKGVTLIRKDK